MWMGFSFVSMSRKTQLPCYEGFLLHATVEGITAAGDLQMSSFSLKAPTAGGLRLLKISRRHVDHDLPAEMDICINNELLSIIELGMMQASSI